MRTHEVVEPRRRDEFVRRSPNTRGFQAHQENIATDDLRGINAEFARKKRVERTRPKRSGGKKRAGIHLPIRRKPFIDLAVHMDGDAWYKSDGAIDKQQAAFDTRAVTHHNAPRKAERTVEPGVVDHAPIRFHIETKRIPRSRKLGGVFDLERRGVAMRCGNLEVIAVFGHIVANAPCNNARGITRGEIAAARLHAPRGVFRKIAKTHVTKTRRYLVNGMKRARRSLNERAESSSLAAGVLRRRAEHFAIWHRAVLSRMRRIMRQREANASDVQRPSSDKPYFRRIRTNLRYRQA